MSLQNNNPPAKPDSHRDAASGPTDSSAQLAHELANLLDGSMRHLGLAINSLRPGQADTPEQAESNDQDDLLHRLKTADQAMKRMATLVHAWMKSAHEPLDLFDRSQSLGKTLDQLVQTHWPFAAQHGIELGLHVNEQAARLPAGPIFPIVSNAIRNSLEAIIDDPDDHPAGHRIDIHVTQNSDRLCLTISDDGPGIDPSLCDRHGKMQFDGQTTKPTGHGIGLKLCRQIAVGLGGELELRNQSPGGALLTVRFPLSAFLPGAVVQSNQRTD